jgi:predicted HicB family RNase H-like nuclease
MKTYFEYKGYLGSAEVDTEGNALVGKLLFIRDVIAYSSASLKDLEKAFHEAVDDYLKTCQELGDEPDTPCKGSFNVRVGPDRHREVALVARSKNLGLNEFVCQALDVAVQAPSRQLVGLTERDEYDQTYQSGRPARV